MAKGSEALKKIMEETRDISGQKTPTEYLKERPFPRTYEPKEPTDEKPITYQCTGTDGGNSITFFIEAECIKVAYKVAGDKVHEVLGHGATVQVVEVLVEVRG